jgi:hypothetical protein
VVAVPGESGGVASNAFTVTKPDQATQAASVSEWVLGG